MHYASLGYYDIKSPDMMRIDVRAQPQAEAFLSHPLALEDPVRTLRL